jgi:hypothetical protein
MPQRWQRRGARSIGNLIALMLSSARAPLASRFDFAVGSPLANFALKDGKLRLVSPRIGLVSHWSEFSGTTGSPVDASDEVSRRALTNA